MDTGVSAGSRRHSGSLVMMWAKMVETSSPSKGRDPVSIS